MERLNESKKVEYVENQYGDEYPFDDVMLGLMDDEIRERVHAELAPCPAQEFFDRYCELHRREFGEDFVFQTRNPQY